MLSINHWSNNVTLKFNIYRHSAPSVRLMGTYHHYYYTVLLLLLPCFTAIRCTTRQVLKNMHNHFMAHVDFVRDYPVSWHHKGKTNLDLMEQETVSGSGISWAICKSAP